MQKQHINEECKNENCDIENCVRRNFNECYFYGLYKKCKFGYYCKYKHKISIEEDIKKTMVCEIEKVMNKVKYIEKEINN